MPEGGRHCIQEPGDCKGEYLDENEVKKADEDKWNEREASSAMVLRSPG